MNKILIGFFLIIVQTFPIYNNEELLKENTYDNIDTTKIFHVDISKVVNMGFKDEIEGDYSGGWTDQGANNDLSTFPLGENNFSGVQFKIIDPKENNGKSCIVLRNNSKLSFPERIDNIQIMRNVKELYFLHAAAYDNIKQHEEVLKYVIYYVDGEELSVSIKTGEEIADWLNPQTLSSAKIGWLGQTLSRKLVCIYCYQWKNPYQGKAIKSLSIVSMLKDAMPGIVAISGIEY